MEAIAPRQADILKRARDDGQVMVDELAQAYQVTPQTIRKDINDLCQRGLLQRIHGGAVPSTSVTNFAYEARRRLAQEEKRLIGVAAARLVPDDCSILINIGTTTEQVAMALRGKRDLLVITNNTHVISILTGHPQIEIIVAGGVVRQSDGGIVGEAAVDFIRQFKVDYAIIGTSGIDPDGSLLDYDYREVKVAKAIMDNARTTILVADSMKLERTAPVRIAHLSDLDYMVTDAPLPRSLQDVCDETDVKVIVAADS